jgi:MFS family permease
MAYFMHIMTLYFLLKWTPKIVVDMGYSASSAGSVLVWANVGMLTGSIMFGLLSSRISIRKLMSVALVMSSIMIYIFGKGYSELAQLSMVAGITGFFINCAVVGLYALLAENNPDNQRASGTGFSIGVGRGGAALSPIAAGILFTAGYGLSVVALFMAFGSVFAAIVLIFLKASWRQDSVIG